MNDSNGQVDHSQRSWLRRLLCGRAPFRQLLLYLFEANGPAFNEMVVRLHLIFTSLFVALHLLVFTPAVAEDHGWRWGAAFALVPLPYLCHTTLSTGKSKRKSGGGASGGGCCGRGIGCSSDFLPVLVRNVTEVGVVGVLQDRVVKKEVLRRAKTQKSLKAILLLQSMRDRSEESEGEDDDSNKDNNGGLRKRAAGGGEGGGGGYGSGGTTQAAALGDKRTEKRATPTKKEKKKAKKQKKKGVSDGGSDVGGKSGVAFEEECAIRAYEEHFDRMQDGFVTKNDFTRGLNELFAEAAQRRQAAAAAAGGGVEETKTAERSSSSSSSPSCDESEAFRLFASADEEGGGRIDLPGFIALFQACVTTTTTTTTTAAAATSGFAVAPGIARVLTSYVAACRDELASDETRAESELAALKRDHGAAVHEVSQ